jgi:hypothetical protein
MKTMLLIFLVIIFCSCGRKSTNDTGNAGSVMAIDLLSEPESENPGVADIATNVDYIPLQTTKNSLVKTITKIVTCDNKIYIRNGLDDILCFDKEGIFLFNLNKSGRGPGEYSYITDFDISSDNKILLVLSSGRILVFNKTGTDFIFTKSINLRQPYPSKISMIPGTSNILLSIDPSTGLEQSLSILINIDGDTLHLKPNLYKFENKTTNYMMINESLHFDFENSVCFKEEASDTVFFVNNKTNEFQPRLILDSHGKGFLPKIRYDKEYARSQAAESYWVYLIIETPRYLIYTYEHNKSRNKILYDKSANKKFKIAQMNFGENFKNELEDDMNGGPFFDPIFCSEGKIYSSVDALTLKKYVAGEEFAKAKVSEPKKKEALKKLADSLNETDNPVLIVVTPRK